MPIYTAAGAAVYSTSNPSPVVPAHAIGDILILLVGTKPDTTPATAPDGWTLVGAVAGGAGTTGVDTGPMRLGVFYKIATTTGTGDNPGPITITGNNVSTAQVLAYSAPAAGKVADIEMVGAADTTAGTPHSVVMPSTINMKFPEDLLAVGVIPTDVSTPAQFSGYTVSAPGFTTQNLTEIVEWDTTSGSDMGGWVARISIGPGSGTPTGPATVSAVAAGTTTNVTGPIALIRIGEVLSNVSLSKVDSGTHSVTESAASIVKLDIRTASDAGTHSVVEGTPTIVKTDAPAEVSSQLVEKTSGVANAVSSWQSQTFTPPANGLVIINLSITGSASETATRAADIASSTISGLGPWTIYQASNSGLVAKTAAYVLVATTGASPSAGTVSITLATAPPDIEISLFAFSGVDQTNPITASVSNMIDGLDYLGLVLPQSPELSGLVHTLVTSRNSNVAFPFPDDPAVQLVSSAIGPFPNATQYVFQGRTIGVDQGIGDLNIAHNSGVSLIIKGAGGPPSETISKSASDSGTHSVVEGTPSISITSDEPVAKSASDSGTHSVTESVSIAVTFDAADTGTHSVTEQTSVVPTDAGVGPYVVKETFQRVAATATPEITFTSSAGNTLIAFVARSGGQGTGSFTSVTDDTGNVWSLITKGAVVGGAATRNEVWWTTSGNARTSGFITFVGSSSQATGVNIVELSGTAWTLDAASPIDSATTVASTVIDSPIITPVASSTWAFASFHASTSTISARPVGWTGLNDFSDATTTPAGAVYKQVTGNAAQQASWTISSSRTAGVTAFTLVPPASTTPPTAKAGSDEGTHSVAESYSITGTGTLTDSGTHSVAESVSILSSGTFTDSGTHSAVEAATIAKSIALSDSGTHSVAESAASIAVLSTRTDAGTHSVTESPASIVISNALSRTDSGTHSATESITIAVTMAVSDVGQHSAVESKSQSVSLSLVDSGTHSTVESRTTAVVLSSSDSGTHSVVESAVPNVSISVVDSGSHSVVEANTRAVNTALTESGTHSVVETRSIASTSSHTDAGTHSVVETASIAVVLSSSDSGTHSVVEAATKEEPYSEKAGTDSGAHSVTESVSIAVTASAVDSGTHSAAESATIFKQIALSDSGTHSVTEAAVRNNNMSASDTGTHSVVESPATIVIAFAKTGSDTGTHSAIEGRSISGTGTVTDSGTHSVTEAATIFKAISLSDSGTHSTVETQTVFSNRLGADSGIHTVAEGPVSIVVSGLVTKSASDSGTHSATDNRTTTAVSLSRADAGTHTVTEVLSGNSTQTRSEQPRWSVVESHQIAITAQYSDSGSHSVVESVSIEKVVVSGMDVDLFDSESMNPAYLYVWNGTQMVTPTKSVWNGVNWS